MATSQFTVDEDIADGLLTFGYLRDLLNEYEDYSFMVVMILLFYQQGFAEFFDADVDKDYEEKMRFGDILRKKNKYMVLDMDNEMTEIGEYSVRWFESEPVTEVTICIPFYICQYLDNAVSFYSKLNISGPFWDTADLYNLELEVEQDDKGLFGYLGGSLNLEYELITMRFINLEIYEIEVNFGELTARFKTDNITHVDIDGYYER